MATFLKLSLFLFIVLFVALGWIVYTFFKQVRKHAQRFSGFSQHREPNYKGEDAIIDNRSMEQRTKKVIKDNEGEYVDFTESDKPSSPIL
ncbi:MAG: hypothetical protein E6507_04975 [Prevotella bivia]|jgi:hypothetical protein|uniref:DUF4834 family protein n=2 Tax=Prevotella bivia TaxID=28125 RepID=A0A096BM36_9BACT|nr:hypothetical protein [Prevotella bivia]KGF21881.1 hypothetical protein HMPREF1651_06805 [Prevotella bivia DNF00188]KGF38400.1 hypothetical protein HMPREF2136_03065 [Prevotella bivia DNF00650]KGF43737.1 hypothetical protein HMPREF0647_09150 [Prevotella bivia DNF00320]KXO18480.1 hypothetical protein HMPREF3202_00019 [Prevotella bivia]KXU58558.1 hypothetical protein HMPREF3218_0201001 [Prevotella bivia]